VLIPPAPAEQTELKRALDLGHGVLEMPAGAGKRAALLALLLEHLAAPGAAPGTAAGAVAIKAEPGAVAVKTEPGTAAAAAGPGGAAAEAGGIAKVVICTRTPRAVDDFMDELRGLRGCRWETHVPVELLRRAAV
jgi:hypothetical protein